MCTNKSIDTLLEDVTLTMDEIIRDGQNEELDARIRCGRMVSAARGLRRLALEALAARHGQEEG